VITIRFVPKVPHPARLCINVPEIHIHCLCILSAPIDWAMTSSDVTPRSAPCAIIDADPVAALLYPRVRLVPTVFEEQTDDLLPPRGRTGVTADCEKIEFRLFNSSSIFNTTLRKEVISKIELELNNLNSILSRSAVTSVFYPRSLAVMKVLLHPYAPCTIMHRTGVSDFHGETKTTHDHANKCIHWYTHARHNRHPPRLDLISLVVSKNQICLL